MANTIASLAVGLTISASQFDAMVDKSKEKLGTIGQAAVAAQGDLGKLDKIATFAQLQNNLETAQRVLQGFRGKGGGEALAGLAANVEKAQKALTDFQAAQGGAFGGIKVPDQQEHLAALRKNVADAQAALGKGFTGVGGPGMAQLVGNLLDARRQLKDFESASRTVWQSVYRYANLAATGIGFIKSAVTGVLNTMDKLPIIGKVFAATQWAQPKWMLDVVKENILEMVAMQKQAERLGVTFNDLAAIQVLAGGAADDMERGMFHLAKTLGAAAAGNEEATKTLTKLGFSAKDFAGLSLDKQLGLVMDHFAAIKDPAQKAYLAFELFGRGGVSLINILSKGSAGLEEARQKVDKFGLGLNSIEEAGVLRAARALKDLDLIVKGIQRSLAVEFAPIVGAIAEAFAKWKMEGGDIRAVMKTVAEVVGQILAAILEAVQAILELTGAAGKLKVKPEDMTEVQKAAQAKIDELEKQKPSAWNIINPFSWFSAAEELDAINDKIKAIQKEAGLNSPLDLLISAMRNLGKETDSLLKKGKDLGAGLPNEQTLKLAEDCRELKEKLQAEADAFGASAEAVQRYKLYTRGASAEQLKDIDDLLAQLKILKQITEIGTGAGNIFDDYRVKMNRLIDAFTAFKITREEFMRGIDKLKESLENSALAKAAEIFKETRSPLETFKAKVEEIQKLAQSGKIDWDTYTRAVGKAAAEFENLTAAQMHHPAPALFGSQEAHKAIVEAHAATDPNRTDPVRALQAAFQRQEAIQKAQLEQAKKIE